MDKLTILNRNNYLIEFYFCMQMEVQRDKLSPRCQTLNNWKLEV